MYLLDTNICIYGMKNRYPSLREKLLTINPSEVYVSAVTVAELEYGAAKSKWSERTRDWMYVFLGSFTILPFEVSDAGCYGQIREYLESKGTPIGPYDMMIAAQGISRKYTVVTHNTKEFSRIPGILLEDWVLP